MTKLTYNPKSFDALDYLAREKVRRRILKKVYNQKPAAPIPSLMEEMHVRYDEDGEGWREYGFFEDEPEMTDLELDKYIWDCLAREYQYRDYDCTGQAFTSWISWHRNPNGYVSIVHRICLDV